jgi:hypothetical protein
MKVTANGRVRRDAGEWRALIERFGQSGQSRRAFCQKEKLSLASFDRWEARLAATAEGGFVEVKPAVAGPAAWAVEIELACGTILRLRG